MNHVAYGLTVCECLIRNYVVICKECSGSGGNSVPNHLGIHSAHRLYSRKKAPNVARTACHPIIPSLADSKTVKCYHLLREGA